MGKSQNLDDEGPSPDFIAGYYEGLYEGVLLVWQNLYLEATLLTRLLDPFQHLITKLEEIQQREKTA